MTRSKPRFDAAASITNELVRIIDRGVLPWRKPWTVGGSAVPLRQTGERDRSEPRGERTNMG